MDALEGIVIPGRSRLLPELLENVIAFVHRPGERDGGHSKKDLSSCCLVSREWHTIARARLFHSVTFTFSDYEDPNAGLAGRDILRRETSSSLASFRDFLIVSPAVSSNIQDLKLNREIIWSTLPPGSNLDSLCDEKASVELVQSLLFLLSRLQHLTLAGIRTNKRPLRLETSPISIRSLLIDGMIGLMPML